MQALYVFFLLCSTSQLRAFIKYCFLPTIKIGLVGNSHNGAAAACLRASLLISETWKTPFNSAPHYVLRIFMKKKGTYVLYIYA